MIRKLFRTKTLRILLLGTVFLGIVFFLRTKVLLTERQLLLSHVNTLINSGNEKLAFEGQACRVPSLDVNATEIVKLLKKSTKVVCNQTKDWIELSGSTLKISSWVKKKYGDIKCLFTDIIRQDDNTQYRGMTTTTHTEYNLETSDVVTVHCMTSTGITWEKVFMGIRSDQDILDRSSWTKVPNDSLKLNILIFGFDSLSHNMWKRKLPKTYKYATGDLKGIALNGYNIVGDGTPQALIPIFTGKTELELPDTRKRMGKRAHFVNVYPFIWNDLQNNGYVTALSEDVTPIGTFTYRLKGFKEQPVDHYMRTYFKEAEPNYEQYRKFCYGELSRLQITLRFATDLFEVYKDRPKFAFIFLNEYSHDNLDWVDNADETFEWLQDFNRKGYLNNTLLILMSDHGTRYSNFRNTLQGKQEERLPGFIFVFPSWFSKKYPEAYENFKKNADRLSTPFDVYETLKNVLHFEGAGMGDTKNRGISLFKEIPLSRSCQSAAIEPHWCTCLNWEPVPIEYNAMLFSAAEWLLNTINRYTSRHRKLCAKLKLKKIIWGAKLTPNEHVLKFRKNSDPDGFLGDMSAQTTLSTDVYQLKLSLDPGDMIFEASIKYLREEKKFLVSEKEISRINKYQHMTHCLEDRDILHHLRKYCYCL